ncbi:hypothetical protein QBC47DRAFT_117993 [Echria macrotheca]|uniref:F-box domain-containing protein n=1 Tax=Echria macrotheca TaxID=438768 RepID=A0AAJ0BML6_9PEZI|nr:hypothetical protein QBC47DRAFT_117993 [Echria macrotheca]
MASTAVGDGPSFPARDTRSTTPTQSSLATATAAAPLASHAVAFSHLDQLPNELLVPIAAGLVPSSPSTTRFFLRPDGTWGFRHAQNQWADWLAAHNDLLAFARTSKRMAAVAKPLLFHTLVIRDAAALIKLNRRMHQRPEIRPWIRELTCLVNVAGTVTIHDLELEWARQTGAKPRPPHSRHTVDFTIGLALLKDIVRNAPNLRDFLLAFPDHELPGSEPTLATLDALDPGIRDAMLHYTQLPNPVMLYEIPFISDLGFLCASKISSLRIYCHREQRDGERIDRDFTLSHVFSDCVINNLAAFSNLRTLELCCSSFGSYTFFDHYLPPLPQVEHLRLYGSYLHEPRLVAAVLACRNLQTLLVHFEMSSTDEDRDELPEGKTLNDALYGLAPTLRSLELVNLSDGHYLTRGRERPRKPENHRLACIPELTKLENLTLDYRGIFGTLGILEEDDGERLCQLLPASLRHFTMVCEWGNEKDWKQSYLANLDMMLYGVECLCQTKSPRLSSISLAIHSWPAKSRFHKRFKREVEAARLRCARAGIEFRTFDLFPSYQDEDDMESVEEGSEGGDEVGEEEFEAEEEEEELELEEEDEASEYYFSGDDEPDPEREALRPKTFEEFLERLGEEHGHDMDELFFAFHEDRWDEYL